MKRGRAALGSAARSDSDSSEAFDTPPIKRTHFTATRSQLCLNADSSGSDADLPEIPETEETIEARRLLLDAQTVIAECELQHARVIKSLDLQAMRTHPKPRIGGLRVLAPATESDSDPALGD